MIIDSIGHAQVPHGCLDHKKYDSNLGQMTSSGPAPPGASQRKQRFFMMALSCFLQVKRLFCLDKRLGNT